MSSVSRVPTVTEPSGCRAMSSPDSGDTPPASSTSRDASRWSSGSALLIVRSSHAKSSAHSHACTGVPATEVNDASSPDSSRPGDR